jgi:hypothetical protein
MTDDISYFRRRASEERTAALNARLPRVRRVHVAAAELYEELVKAKVSSKPKVGLEAAGAD